MPTGSSGAYTLFLVIALILLVAMRLLVAGWLSDLQPSGFAQELLHPVRPGVAMDVTVRNLTAQATPPFALLGPTRTVQIGAIAPGAERTTRIDDPVYGDLVLQDSATDTRYMVFPAQQAYQGVGGAFTVRWGDPVVEGFDGSVVAGPYRFAPRQWHVENGVWLFTREPAHNH